MPTSHIIRSCCMLREVGFASPVVVYVCMHVAQHVGHGQAVVLGASGGRPVVTGSRKVDSYYYYTNLSFAFWAIWRCNGSSLFNSELHRYGVLEVPNMQLYKCEGMVTHKKSPRSGNSANTPRRNGANRPVPRALLARTAADPHQGFCVRGLGQRASYCAWSGTVVLEGPQASSASRCDRRRGAGIRQRR